jgi:uncharacterized lipoprotein YddW (UPF0748 family)
MDPPRLKRPFRLTLLALLAALLPTMALAIPPLPPVASPQPQVASPPPLARAQEVELRGVWMTGNDMPTLRDSHRLGAAVAELSRLNLNTLYPVVWNGGLTYYPSAVMQRRGFQSFSFRGLQGQDILSDMIVQAHGKGLLVLPWFEFGLMVPPSSEIAERHPQWLSRRLDGGATSFTAAGEVAWLNPFHPEVQQFISELVLEILTAYDADGIQFDDHFSLPSQFGYDPFTVALYRSETKKAPPANPQDPAWIQWRADRISAFLARLRQEIRSRRPKALVSVSPNYHDFAFRFQLQNWLAWVRRGLVDEVVVQVYRPDLASFKAQLERPELDESRAKVATAIGIMGGQRTNPVPMGLIRDQALAARARGLGVAIFSFETLWERTAEPAALRLEGWQQLFGAPAPRTR